MKNKITTLIGILIAFICTTNMNQMSKGNHTMTEEVAGINSMYNDSIELILPDSKESLAPIGGQYFTIHELVGLDNNKTKNHEK